MNAVYFMNLPYEKINNSLPFTPQASFQNSPGTGLTQNAQLRCICHCILFASTPCLYCIFYSLNFQRFRRWKYFALFISQTFLLYIFYFQFIIKGIYRLINHTNLIFTFCIFIAQHTMNISDNTQYFIYSRLRQMHIIYNSTLCK